MDSGSSLNFSEVIVKDDTGRTFSISGGHMIAWDGETRSSLASAAPSQRREVTHALKNLFDLCVDDGEVRNRVNRESLGVQRNQITPEFRKRPQFLLNLNSNARAVDSLYRTRILSKLGSVFLCEFLCRFGKVIIPNDHGHSSDELTGSSGASSIKKESGALFVAS